MVRTLLRHWMSRLFPSGNRPGRVAPGRFALRPTLEVLEDRLTPSVTFTAQQTFAGGVNPQAVAVGDFNGDGRPDLVTLNASMVSVLLNTTTSGSTAPSFAAAQTFAVGAGADAVAVGDFNGDGRPDIVVANATTGSVLVLWNSTTAGASVPSFVAAQQTFAVGADPVAVAVADFNGDGRADLVVANGTSSAVSVLLNTTTAGTFTLAFSPLATFSVGSHPQAVATADFNGDGRADIVTANSGDGTVSVLLNTTAGSSGPSFAPQQTFAVGASPVAVAVGDFNGDARPDLAVANATAGTVSVLLDTTAAGASAASFAGQQTFAVGGNPRSVAVADFDGDGRPDLVVANNSTNKTASVLVNTTTAGAAVPSFAAQQTFNIGAGAASAAAADFNGDNRPDFIVADGGDNTVSVLLNTTTPFTTTTPVIVAEFQGGGVWELNRTSETWTLLTPSNASLLAADPQGDVVGEFPHYGLWEYRAATASWTQLITADASALAMDAHGDVAATFPHYGVAEYLPSSGWRMIGPSDASLLVMDANGDVVGEYPGAGVWEFRPTSGWAHIATGDANALAINALGEVAASFANYGIAVYLPTTGWQLLNGNQALAVAIDPYGDVTASIRGLGIAEYRPAYGWRGQSASSPSILAMDANGDIFAEIPGYGVWEFDPFPGWYRLSGTDAGLLVVA